MKYIGGLIKDSITSDVRDYAWHRILYKERLHDILEYKYDFFTYCMTDNSVLLRREFYDKFKAGIF